MSRVRRPAKLLLAVAALALGSAGCGGDSGADENGGLSGEEAEVSQAIDRLQRAFSDADGTAYCEQLTDAGRRQVERFDAAFGKSKECAAAIDRLAKLTGEAGASEQPREVRSVRIEGERAVARFAPGNGPIVKREDQRAADTIVAVRDGGEWKIPDPGFSTEIVPAASDPTD